jgi:UDP-GlcNAc:undecaprenyl-phosphate/decaprenyl-phosphate GlcNAc-1-phosphate transferase
MTDISILFLAVLSALVVIFGSAWASVRLTFRLRLIDKPGEAPHKLHTSPRPIAGGIAMLAALLISALLFKTGFDHDILVMLLAASVIFAFGLWDDAKNISPLAKLAGQGLAAVVLIWLDVHIRIFESPGFFIQLSHPWDVYVDWVLTVLWVLGVTNAFNFIDSMDGLAVGIGGIAAAFFMLMSLEAGQTLLAVQFALILGICAGLYFFNSPPALFFIGDSGAQTLGFVLAVLAILYTPQGAEQSSSWLVPVVVLALPIFDTALVIVSRLRRGRHVYLANLDHTYHRLVAFGLNSNRAVLAMQFAALFLGCLAFIALYLPPIWANMIFFLCLAAAVSLIIYFDSRKRWL